MIDLTKVRDTATYLRSVRMPHSADAIDSLVAEVERLREQVGAARELIESIDKEDEAKAEYYSLDVDENKPTGEERDAYRDLTDAREKKYAARTAWDKVKP